MAKPDVKTIRSETLQEEVQWVLLPGGLPVLFCPKPGFRKKYACYSVFYGSVDRMFRGPGEASASPVPDGIAHFLEHALFETPEGNASDLFARNGAESNASTSFTTTTYLFASGDRFFENLKLLIDFVENPVFHPDKIEKEKGIIEQEILRYRDDPGWVGYMGFLESLFAAHPIRIDIAGTPESIRRIDSDVLHRCYRTFYHPRNMILFVIGDLDGDRVFEFAAASSRHGRCAAGQAEEAPAEAAGAWNVERFYPEEPDKAAAPEFRSEMEVALPKLLLGFKETGVPRRGRELLLRELSTAFALDLIFGKGSDNYLRLYTAQLVLDDFSASYHSCAGVGCVAIGGETPDPAGLQKALGEIIGKVRDRGFPPDDFRRQKRKFIGGFIRGFNSLEFIASNYSEYRFHDLDLFDVIDALESIPQEAVEARYRDLFDPDRQAVSLIVPRS